MQKYVVVASVAHRLYATTLEARSLYDAEHRILDHGICWRDAYGVEAAMAFEIADLKSDVFIGMMQGAEMIGLDLLYEIIAKNNHRIHALMRATDRVNRLEKEIRKLTEEQKQARTELYLLQSSSIDDFNRALDGIGVLYA